jgi:hypothetical protein
MSSLSEDAGEAFRRRIKKMGDVHLEDSVTARVVPIDIASIIRSQKQRDYEQFGKPRYEDEYYEKAIDYLNNNAMDLFERNRLSREYVRAILQNPRPEYSLSQIEGNLGENFDDYYPGTIVFPTVKHSDWFGGASIKAIQRELYRIGLIDYTAIEGGITYTGFQSEIVRSPAEKGFTDTNYRRNVELRGAIEKMLSPFNSEKPVWYVNKKQRSPIQFEMG